MRGPEAGVHFVEHLLGALHGVGPVPLLRFGIGHQRKINRIRKSSGADAERGGETGSVGLKPTLNSSMGFGAHETSSPASFVGNGTAVPMSSRAPGIDGGCVREKPPYVASRGSYTQNTTSIQLPIRK